jgi:ubiquinone/menaquinone biosynthesis C-methylase UbiE
MDVSSFFTDHWKDIEDERISRYEQMFVWREGQRALLAPARIAPGQRVLDLGAGPGFFALALADMVGPAGSVDGVDINARFVADANGRAQGRANVRFHQVGDHRLPFADDQFDRVICKNVLEYVPDLDATLTECRRVLKPGGRIHVIDSDWGFVVVEPWGKAIVDRFFAAAAPAFNEPHIGRRVPGLLARACFERVEVQLSGFVDREGVALNVLTNMAGYIATFDSMPAAEVADLLDQCRAGIADGTFLFCLPQFLVSAGK